MGVKSFMNSVASLASVGTIWPFPELYCTTRSISAHFEEAIVETYVHDRDLPCGEGRGERRAVSARADCVQRAGKETLLADEERLQSALRVLVYGTAYRKPTGQLGHPTEAQGDGTY